MKKFLHLIVVGFMLLGFFSAHSAPVDTATAKLLAQNFYRQMVQVNSSQRMNLRLIKTFTSRESGQTDRNVQDTACFYIMNIDSGYVIFAADDRVSPILAYSTTSSFNIDYIPDNLAFWLEGYRRSILEIIRQDRAPESDVVSYWRKLYNNEDLRSRLVYGPLLSTRWGQGCYYNSLCPSTTNSTFCNHSPTGCGPTAVAQIMKYWNYPPHGVGSVSSSTSPGTLINLENFSFNYSSMPDILNANSTSVQETEVARLMRLIGDAWPVTYGNTATGSNATSLMNGSLLNHFGYVKKEQWSDFTIMGLYNYHVNMLSEGIPLFWAVGDNTQTHAHAFVVDGVSVMDGVIKYHINWGAENGTVGWYEYGSFLIDGVNYNVIECVLAISPAMDTVTLTSTAGGSASGGGTYRRFNTVTVQATPVNGYVFAGWKENGTTVSTNATYSFEVNGNRSLQACFTGETYTLSASVTPSNSGYVNGVRNFSNTYPRGTSVTLTAQPSSGYAFKHWRNTANNTTVMTNPLTMTVNSNLSLQAVFEQSQNYTVTVASNNNSLGVVRIGTSGSTQSGSYAYGQQVTVSATALGNNQFLCWKIGSQTVSAEPTYTFIVTGNTDLNAYFKQSTQYYQVTTSSSPSVGGTTTGGGSFVSGSSVTVSASPSQGYHFVKWTENGNTISNYANYTISSLSSSRNLVANFAQNQTTSSGYVNASASPSNGGYVTGNGTYTVGSSVTLNAYPYSGYTFLYWSQGSTVLSTSSSYTFSMPSGGDVNITASFEVASTDYYIYNYSDLNALRAGVNSGAPFLWNYSTVPTGAEGITFHLANNIDNVGFWIPIGNGNSPFLGTFDGAGHYISGVNMNSGDDYTGFFGYIGSTAEIKNLKVINSDIGGDIYVGGICGYNDGGEINNCRYGGEVSGSQYVGGICGQNTGHIYRCGNYNQDFTVSGSLMVGGITGATTDNFSTVSFCDVLSYGTTANITANSSVGGICGFLSDGIVNNCLSAASEINGGDRTGGICGEVTNYGDVFTSGNVSPIYAANYTGGIVGMMSNGGWIEDCYNSNIVSGSNYVGGICGRLTNNNNNTKITQSYNVGVVYGGSIKGAVCASSTGSITNCFYDKQMCTIGDSYATGKLTVEMVGTSLRSGLGHLWIYRDDRYPVFDGLCVQSRIASAPVFLHYTNANDYETVDAVRSSFTVAVENSSFQWSKYNNSDVVDLSDVANGNISLLHAGAVSLQAHSNLYPAGSNHDDCRKIVDIWVPSSLYRYVSVSADPSSYGTVSGAGTYNNGSTCTVTASPYSGYHFVHWTENGNVVSTDATYTFTATSNRDLVAHFQVNSYMVTATSNPTNGGVTEGSGIYNHGATATLTATPTTHYTFSRWTDNGSTISYNTTYSFSVTRDVNIVAQYTANNYTITTNVTPSGGGSVSGGGTYVYGTSITLQAIPATGYYFVGWRINNTIVSTSATYVWTVTGNATLTGVFEKQSYTVTVSSNSSSQGSVIGGGVYQYGTSVTIQAFPATGYHFMYWKNINNTIVSTQSIYSFTVTSNKTYTAFFAADPTPPIVTTSAVNNIATNSASSGGNVTATGGNSVTARGVCWGVLHNPTVNNSHTTDGSGLGNFTSSISDLMPNTTYYVRAYATNAIGTAYGNEVSFTTGCDVVNVSVSGDEAVLSGQAAILTASGASSYAWSTGATGSSITVYPTATTTYTVTGTNDFGCTGTASVTVNNLSAADAHPCPGHATVTDYDGNVYNTVRIGQQCWMKENLRTTHFVDGSEIPLGTTASTTVPYRYEPTLDHNDVAAYGYFYNWAAVMRGMPGSDANPSGVQGICPTGWHLPSDAEWTQLTDYVKSVPNYTCGNGWIAKALASTIGWVWNTGGVSYGSTACHLYNVDDNNSTGFSAMPAGYRTSLVDTSGVIGDYFLFRNGAFFGSCTDNSDTTVKVRVLLSWIPDINNLSDYKRASFSIRCILGDGINLPAVTTAQVTHITTNSAYCGGSVNYAGNTNVTERGVCWSTSPQPTVDDNHTTYGVGIDNFTSMVSGLVTNTVYYVRAYATNSAGTVYGNEVSFTTACDEVNVSVLIDNTTIPSGQNTMLTASGASSYAWSTGGTGSSISVNPTAVTTYTVTGVNGYGCTATASVTLNVLPVGDALPCPGHTTVTDYDGNVYNTVKIGQQCWMKENLRTTHYEDGTEIPIGYIASSISPYQYIPNNDASTIPVYGRLYNWKAAMHGMSASSTNPSGVQGICPSGWHLPSHAEFLQLINYMSSEPLYCYNGHSNYLAKALASTTGWVTESTGIGYKPNLNNTSGFSAYPAGFFTYTDPNDESDETAGDYMAFGEGIFFWSTSDSISNTYITRGLVSFMNVVSGALEKDKVGVSLRCVLGDGVNLPAVTTAQVMNITNNSATCGGNVTYAGNTNVTARGICWSTSQNPTVNDSHTTNGTGAGNYTSSMTGLMPNTVYYVRAYATNCAGTVYGEQKMFTATCSPISVSITGPTSFCEGNTGTLAAETGAQSPQYHWSDGSSGASITVGQSGTYGVTVTDANGCQGSASSSVTVQPSPSVPVVTIGNNTSCASPNGTITVATPAGGGYTYSINGGAFQVGRAFHGLGGGTYVVTVRNSSGCEASNQVTVQSLGSEVDAQASSNTPCAGATLSLTGGSATPGVTYAWTGPNGFSSTQQSPQIANVSPSQAGVYTVTVTETSTSCTNSATVEVTVNALPTVSISGPASFCEGNAGTLAAETGAQNPQYLWNNGNTGPSISVSQSGTYGVTVTDASGCQGSASSSVTVLPLPSTPVVTIGNNTSCASPNGTITVATPAGGGYTYSINGGAFQVGRAFHGLGGGTYVVTVRNSSGCEASSQVTVQSVGSSVDAQASCNTPCAGATLMLTGSSSTSGVTYAWTGPNGFSSTQQSPQIANVSPSQAGVYVVTVTETSTSCTNSATVEVTVNALPTVSISGPTSFCEGNTGTLAAETGVQSPQYHWSDGSGGSSITVGQSGTYGVTVTDASGCQGSASSSVTVLPLPSVPVVTIGNNTSCASPNGTITVTAPAGGGYTYSINGGAFQVGRAFHGLGGGTYVVTVRNSSGCEASNQVTVQSLGSEVDAQASSNTPCAGATLSLTGGSATPGVTYSWSGPNGYSSTQQSPQILNVSDYQAGVYTVTVTETSTNCTGVAAVEVTVNTPNVSLLDISDETVCAGENVVLNAVLSGPATGMVSYVWSGPNGFQSTLQSPVIQNVTTECSGTYSVTAIATNIVNGESCTSTDSKTVIVSLLPQPMVTLSTNKNQSVCAGSPINAISVNVANGTPTVMNLPLGLTYNPTTRKITGTPTTSGTYTIVVSNPTCGTATASGTISIIPLPEASLSDNRDQTVCAGSAIMPIVVTAFNASVSVTNLPAGLSYNPNINRIIGTPTSSGTYMVVVSGGNCGPTTTTGTITVDQPMPCVISVGGNTTICEGNSTVLTASVAGDPDTVTYVWTPSTGIDSTIGANVIANPMVTTTYTVSGNLTKGACTSMGSVQVTVNVNTLPAVSITGPTGVCPGGSVTLNAPEGYNSYQWSNNTHQRSTMINEPGSYSVTVTDANGCQNNASAYVTTLPSPAVPSVVITNNTSCALPNGSIMVTSPIGNFSYSIGGGFQNSPTFTNLSANTYTLEVKNLSGCLSSSQFEVLDVSNDVDAHASATTPCLGEVMLLNGFSATPDVTYAWSGPNGYTSEQQSPQINNVTIDNAGVYTLTVTEVETSCSKIDTVYVSVNVPQHTAVDIEACGSYRWNNTTYSESGNYIYAHEDANGCVQVDTLHLTIYSPQNIAQHITACDSFVWNNSTYYQSGVYMYSHTDEHFCVQVDTLYLTLNEAPVVTTNGNQNIFVGNSVTLSAYGANSYLWSTSEMSSTITVTPSNTTTYSVVGITNGCVSAPVYVMVIVNPCVLTTGDTTAVACDAFTWYEHTYLESGDYGRIFTASTGCDSLVTLHLTVNHGTFNVFTDTVYAPYTWHGQVYDSSGTYIFHYANENGCNSADTLHLTYYPPYASEFSVTACGSYEWNDRVYVMSGDYVHNYTSVVGSDSVVTLHLIVLPVDTIHERVVTRDSCYQWYGIWYCESGEYTQVFENQYGCDSVYILYLIVNDPVGIEHFNMGYHLFVSPNPATSMVNIRIDNENERIQYVEILDALGRVVKKCMLPEAQNEQQVNISELSNGVYYIKVYSKSRFLGTVKVVKQ